MSTERIKHIDIAKGIGILLVALAHADISIISPYLHRFIYAFHMPLFFFLSGYFLNLQNSFLKTLGKRFHTILKPYFLAIILIYVTSISFSNMRFATAIGRIVKSIYATGYYIDWVQLWFLPSLFVTSLFSYLFYLLVLNRVNNRYARWVILLAMVAITSPLLDVFYPFSVPIFGKVYELYGLPFSLDLVFISGFFYILGNEIRQTKSERILANPWFLLITGIPLVLLVSFFPQRMDFNTRLFESMPLNLLEAVLGILLTLAVSTQIDLHSTKLASVLNYIGQASLFILIFHVPIQEFWGEKIYFVTKVRTLSIILAFIISILISLGIYRLFFEKNPIALYWFGRKSSPKA